MSNLDVLFFVEHKDREMEGTLAVKKQLESYGLKVAIASIEFGLAQAYLRYSPKVICMPYLKSRKSTVARVFAARDRNTIFLNLNYEQLFWKMTEEFKRPRDKFAKDEVYHFAWGNNFKKYLERKGVPESQIFIVGKPEIQFLKEKKEREKDLKGRLAKERNLDVNKKWCFLPLNDGSAFRTDQMIDTLVKKSHAIKGHLFDTRRIAKEQITNLLKFITELDDSELKQKIEFIYRPHPGVTEAQILSIISELGKEKPAWLHIDRSYSVKEWLCCSDVCITNWSTVIVDAALIGLNSFSFYPHLMTESMQSDWLPLFPAISNYDDFCKALMERNEGEAVNGDKFKDYFDTSSSVIEKWAKAINELTLKYGKEDHSSVFSRLDYQRVLYLLRAECRRLSRKLFSGKFVKKAIQYDYFEIID